MKETTVTEQRIKAQYSEKSGVMGRVCVCSCLKGGGMWRERERSTERETE